MTTLTDSRRRRARTRGGNRGRAPSVRSAPHAVPRTLALLTFNIAAAAVPRAEAILGWLRSRCDDVLVLTETSAGPGTELIVTELRGDGYAVFHTVDARERGVLVASRVPVVRDLSPQLAVTLPCRAAAVVLDTAPRIAVFGTYIPSRDRSEAKVARKEAFIASLLESLQQLPLAMRQRLVLAGDYNAVARGHQPSLPGFFPWEYGLHEQLEQIGLSAAHELRPRGGHPHSWIGRTGLRYLYDYVHVGSGLERTVERCEYLHAPRERRLSDHAALAVRLRIP